MGKKRQALLPFLTRELRWQFTSFSGRSDFSFPSFFRREEPARRLTKKLTRYETQFRNCLHRVLEQTLYSAPCFTAIVALASFLSRFQHDVLRENRNCLYSTILTTYWQKLVYCNLCKPQPLISSQLNGSLVLDNLCFQRVGKYCQFLRDLYLEL